MPFKLMPCHFEKKQDGYLKENKMCLCLFLPISGYNALHSDFSLTFYFSCLLILMSPFIKKMIKNSKMAATGSKMLPKCQNLLYSLITPLIMRIK